MERRDWLMKEWEHEIELAKFSLIAAQLLVEELDNIPEDDWKTLKQYKRRHAKHIRSANRHRRRASRIMDRLEKASKNG